MNVHGRLNLQVLRQVVNKRVDLFEIARELVPQRLFQLYIQLHVEAVLAVDAVQNQQFFLELFVGRLDLGHHLRDHGDDIGKAYLAPDHENDSCDLLGWVRRRNVAVADRCHRGDREVEAGQV